VKDTTEVPARPFDPHRRCASPAIKEVVQEVLQQMSSYEYYYDTRKRKHSAAAQAVYEATVEAVVCDLVHREVEVPGGQIHVT
jgi:putative hemolysin